MRRFVWAICGFVVGFGLLFSGPAAANGRFPASNAVMFDPHDPNTIYVRVTFGLLASHDAGATWAWVCERAIGFSGIEDPTYVVTPKGTLIGGTFSGIAVSRDGGCGWAFSGGSGSALVSDLAMRADGSVVGVTSVYAKPGVYDNKVLVSKDDGQTFTQQGAAVDPTILVESIEVTPSDPVRLYISAVRGENDSRTATFLVSYNDAMSWVERKLDLVAGETAAYIANVDPKNADRVYVRTSGVPEAKTRLLVTDDAGKTWKKVFDSTTPILGFALSDDGSKVFVGNKEGVSIAPSDTMVFAKGSSIETQCLGVQGSTVWACSTERSGFFAGSSKTNGRSFEARVHLEEIKGPLACPAETSVGKQCTTDWVKQRRDLGLPEPGDKKGASNSGAPAMHGRGAEKKPMPFGIRSVIAMLAILYLAYEVLKFIRKRQKR